MLYKVGLEAFNGSITTLASDRFKATNTFAKLGLLTGVYLIQILADISGIHSDTDAHAVFQV